MAAVPDLDVKIVVKTRGMWKLALIGFLFRHKSIRHVVHIHLNDGRSSRCLTHGAESTAAVKPPSLAGQ